MCGIAGYFSNTSLPESILKNMVETLYHRGPDSAGYYSSGAYHAGMRRLSINGLINGDQPFYNHDRSLVMFYNGEIYNYPALKKELEAKGYTFKTGSDGEAVIHLFDMIGVKAFERLDGMYGIAIWSEKEQKLYLARDIPGEKPLYYARLQDGGLAFGSEMSVFKHHPKFSLRLNMQAIWDFPTFLWIPEPDTIYEGVSIIPRGTYLEFDGIDISFHTIQNRFTKYSVKQGDSWDDLKDKTRAVVTEAVQSRLLADVPVGAFLSSGLDSSIVATLAQQQLGNLTTFSIGYKDDASDPYEGNADEFLDAAAYANELGIDHHVIHVSADDFKNALPLFCERAGQPYAVSSGLGVMFVAKTAQEHDIKTLLSGDGADELFGGYSWYQYLNHPALNSGKQASPNSDVSMHNMGMGLEDVLSYIGSYNGAKQAWAWHYYASENEKASLFNPELMDSDLQSSLRIFERYKSDAKWTAVDFIRQDRACYLPFEMMVKLDRMTMAYSIEGRAPLVAPSILHFTDGLEYQHMVKDGVLKPLLREAFADVLPKSVTGRPKHGFRVPIDHWLQNDWSDLVDHAFAPDFALNKHNLLSKNARQTALNMISSSTRVNGHTILCYIMLNMYLENFYEHV